MSKWLLLSNVFYWYCEKVYLFSFTYLLVILLASDYAIINFLFFSSRSILAKETEMEKKIFMHLGIPQHQSTDLSPIVLCGNKFLTVLLVFWHKCHNDCHCCDHCDNYCYNYYPYYFYYYFYYHYYYYYYYYFYYS